MDASWTDVETGEVNSGDPGLVNMFGREANIMYQPNQIQNFYRSGLNESLIHRQTSDCRAVEKDNLQVPISQHFVNSPHSLSGFTGTTVSRNVQMSRSAPVSIPSMQNGLSSGYSSPSSSISDSIGNRNCTDDFQCNIELPHLSMTGSLFENSNDGSSFQKSQQSIIQRDRRRREDHNKVEKKRREIINNTIKELGELLPKSKDPNMKHNRGNILKRTVDYVKELKGDQNKIPVIETRISDLEIQNRLLLKTIGENEKLLRDNEVKTSDQSSMETSLSVKSEHSTYTKMYSSDAPQMSSQPYAEKSQFFNESFDLTSWQHSHHNRTCTQPTTQMWHQNNMMGSNRLWQQDNNAMMQEPENGFSSQSFDVSKQHHNIYSSHFCTNSQNAPMQGVESIEPTHQYANSSPGLFHYQAGQMYEMAMKTHTVSQQNHQTLN